MKETDTMKKLTRPLSVSFLILGFFLFGSVCTMRAVDKNFSFSRSGVNRNDKTTVSWTK